MYGFLGYEKYFEKVVKFSGPTPTYLMYGPLVQMDSNTNLKPCKITY